MTRERGDSSTLESFKVRGGAAGACLGAAVARSNVTADTEPRNPGSRAREYTPASFAWEASSPKALSCSLCELLTRTAAATQAHCAVGSRRVAGEVHSTGVGSRGQERARQQHHIPGQAPHRPEAAPLLAHMTPQTIAPECP